MHERLRSETTFMLTLATCVAVLPVAGLAVAAFTLLSYLGGPLPDLLYFALQVGIGAVLSFAAMNHLLNPTRPIGMETLGQASLSAVKTFLGLSLLLAILLRLGGVLAGLFIEALGEEAGWSVRMMLRFGLPALFVAALGTILPASVDDGDTSVRAALARHTAAPVFWRMMIVFTAMAAVGTAVLLTLAPAVAGKDEQGSVAIAILAVATGTVLAVGTVAIAAILTRAYAGAFAKGVRREP